MRDLFDYMDDEEFISNSMMTLMLTKNKQTSFVSTPAQ